MTLLVVACSLAIVSLRQSSASTAKSSAVAKRLANSALPNTECTCPEQVPGLTMGSNRVSTKGPFTAIKTRRRFWGKRIGRSLSSGFQYCRYKMTKITTITTVIDRQQANFFLVDILGRAFLLSHDGEDDDSEAECDPCSASDGLLSGFSSSLRG